MTSTPDASISWRDVVPLTSADHVAIFEDHGRRTMFVAGDRQYFPPNFQNYFRMEALSLVVTDVTTLKGHVPYAEAVRRRFKHMLSFHLIAEQSPEYGLEYVIKAHARGSVPRYLNDLLAFCGDSLSGDWNYRNTGLISFKDEIDHALVNGILAV